MEASRLLRLSNFTLDRKTAIVTGAAQGMGEAFATVLALNGARVAVCDVNIEGASKVASNITANSWEAAAFKTDVSNSESVSKTIADVSDALGAPDVLVNNAGVLEPTSFQNISELEWNRIMRVNVDGVFHCCREVVPLMIDKRYGKIVNISSTAGKASSTFGGTHYTASKAAVLGITRHLARELAPFNVNVNAVCPGSIDTPMIRGKATPEKLEEGISKIPLGRLGRPEEVANLVLFLSSDASSYVTGASVDINGGELTT